MNIKVYKRWVLLHFERKLRLKHYAIALGQIMRLNKAGFIYETCFTMEVFYKLRK